MGSNRHGKTGADVEVRLPLGSVVTDARERREDRRPRQRRASGFSSSRAATAAGATSISRRRRVRRRGSPSRVWPGRSGGSRSSSSSSPTSRSSDFPTPGKSTLISAISAAKPKIADYPFTTLVPHLGVVTSHHDQRTLVVADIPGLIEGAHRGAGLGIRFLKHVERCRLLCHLVDASAEGDAEADVATIERELAAVLGRRRPAAARPRRLPSATPCRIPERRDSIRRGRRAAGPARISRSRRPRGAGLQGARRVSSFTKSPRRRTSNRRRPEDVGSFPMRIGVFGGTFDPVHNGHVLPVEAAATKFQLRRVFYVPARLSPHKETSPTDAAAPRRDARAGPAGAPRLVDRPRGARPGAAVLHGRHARARSRRGTRGRAVAADGDRHPRRLRAVEASPKRS